MLRVLKVLFLGVPAVLLLGIVGCQTVDEVRVEAHFMDVTNLGWGAGTSAIEVEVTESRGDTFEIRRFDIEAVDARGKTLVRRSLDVDEDRWGGGFVAGMQVDDDPEPELVAWGLHESKKSSFYLDHENGTVTVRPFAEASPKARSLALERHQVREVNGGAVGVLIFLGVAYYLAVAFVWFVVRLARSTSPRPSEGPNQPLAGSLG